MMDTKNTGKIFLPTLTAAALFEHSLLGQFSDGMWENSTPHGHWKPWHHLEIVFDTGCTPRVEGGLGFRKKNYNLMGLLEYVQDEMLALGRMTLAAAHLGIDLTGNARNAAQYGYMPATLEDWTARKESGKWGQDHVTKYMVDVTPELAAAFYQHEKSYTLRDLKADLKACKAAISTVNCY